MYREKKKKGRQSSMGRYALMPRVAAVLFIITAVIIKTGLADKPQAAMAEYFGRLPKAFAAFSSVMKNGEEEESPTLLADDGAEACQLSYESAEPSFFTPSAPQEAKEVTIDGSSGGYSGSGTVYVKNETDYEIDIAALLAEKSKVKLSGDKVQVLIMHTHGTEAYTPTAENYYTPTDTDRTTDKNYNVLRVGQRITDILNARGIKTVHSETLNDSPAYSGSYTRALSDISAYIKENPSIKLVIDVHRDAMVASNGTKYKTVANIQGQQAAQLMLVCGTDAGGLVHDGWRDNLSFQLKLQDRLNTNYPGIMRPVNIRAARFNQHVTTGSMLVEVGTSGNTLEEALISADIFANQLADMLLS